MNRNERDWPAVRAAVEARMRELRLSTADLARRARMSETTHSRVPQGTV
jgi:lambda repressor-like predicted transcriptional regulator